MTPLVLVHGNPEIDAIWDPLVAALDREAIRLSPPGFGAPVPEGFDPSPEAYRAWLAGELEAIGEPVDLVGHDWGGGHVVNVAMTRPELLRTWASDAIGVFHPDYVWHERAQIWQREGDGEEWITQVLAATPDQLAQSYASRGMARPIALRVAAAFSATTGDAILRLYRAARQPAMAELGEDLAKAAQRPGLVLLATRDDAVGTDDQRREAAATAGAGVAVVEGGHWWLTESAAVTEGAAALRSFWAAQG
jgi:pimeloyl-ACP methyl ester carboxylesterase